MEKSSEAVKGVLLEENDEFRELNNKHRELDEKLHILLRRAYLSEDEKLEEVSLKKQKLAVKDKMAEMIRKYQGPQFRQSGAPTPHA